MNHILPITCRKLFLKTRSLGEKLLCFLRARSYGIMVILAIIVYGVVFSYFTVLKHNVFQSYAWDLGSFNQAFYTTLHEGKLFYYTTELFFNLSGSYFAMHISPILFLLLPFYAIYPSPVTLLVTKSFILALGALPLYFLARELLKDKKAALILSLAYLLYPPLQGANWFDFQQQVFLPLFFFSMTYFMIKQRWKPYFLFVALILMVEEHLAIILFVFAAYFLLRGGMRSLVGSVKSVKMNQSLASLATMTACVVFFVVAISVKNTFPINPELMEYYKAVSNFRVLGVENDMLMVPLHALLNPQLAFAALTYDFPLKFLYIIFLFAPLVFISFKNALTLGTLFLLAPLMLSNYAAYYMIGVHYPLYVLALIFVGAVLSLQRLSAQSRLSILKNILVVSMIFALSISPISPLSKTFVNEGLLWYPQIEFPITEDVRSLHEIVNVIPPDASVLAQNHVFPHVSSRINAYALSFYYFEGAKEYVQLLVNSSQYVIIDLKSRDYMTGLVLAEMTKNDSSFGVYALGSNSILFKREYRGQPLFLQHIENRVYTAYRDLTVTIPPSTMTVDPTAESDKIVLCPKGSGGCFVFGPYSYLLEGSYEVTFTIKVGEHSDSYLGTVDISDDYGLSVLSKRDIYGFEANTDQWTNFTLSLSSTRFRTALEYRVISSGKADISVDRVIIRRVSPNVTVDFGFKTLSGRNLAIGNGNLTDDGFIAHEANDTAVSFWYGPYMHIPLGNYSATFLLKIQKTPQELNETILTLSISSDFGRNLILEQPLTAENFTNGDLFEQWHSFTFKLTATDPLDNVEFRGMRPSPNCDIYLAYVAVQRLE